MSQQLQEYVNGLGFPYSDNVILSFIGGSQLHGAKLQDTDDTDWYGLYIEPAEKLLGLDSYEHFVHTTGGQRGGNRPSDTDVCMYGLKKWSALAAKGNPSVLHFLFARPEFVHLVWGRLALKRHLFLAKSHVGAFLGYANAQLKRLLNQQGQKDCHRPFLEEQHGYDTKYAMHITRLLYEVRELLDKGHITLPRPEKDLLVAIRKGKFKLYELEQMNNQLEKEALEAAKLSDLPERVDRAAISQLVSQTYLDYWEWQGRPKPPGESEL
jgi:predicted nucleotidyltransferase